VGVGLLDVEQVIIGDILFVGTVAFFDIGLQLGNRCIGRSVYPAEPVAGG
jgi:hypothetical protein